MEGLRLAGVAPSIDEKAVAVELKGVSTKVEKDGALKGLTTVTLSCLAKAAGLDLNTKKKTGKALTAANEVPGYNPQLMYVNRSVLVFEMPCEYRTQIVKMDTKEFGLPQTRSRVYMFAWRADTWPDIPHAAIGRRWVELVQCLKAPLLHPVGRDL